MGSAHKSGDDPPDDGSASRDAGGEFDDEEV